tara:strand:+ start:25671 stop:26741 length:1071 start_codon:yes stop_codon:yes gene_type:complete
MPLSYNKDNFNKVVDRSTTLNVIPNQWGLIQDLGLFRDEYKTQKQILIPRYIEDDHVVTDRNWDERNNTIAGEQRDELSVKVPHFPLDDAITPNDIDGTVSFLDMRDGIELETVATTRARKMQRMARAHALTKEIARAQAITTGTVYAPNKTLKTSYGDTINWYTEFGITRTEVVMDLADETINPKVGIEEVLAGIQDGYLSGSVVNGFVALCSPEFFNALTSHPYFIDSVKYFQQPQSLAMLTGRLDATGLDARYRSVTFAGMTFVEYRGSYTVNGVTTSYIPAGDAYAFPVGMDDMFVTYYAPANRFNSINRTALPAYWYEYLNEKDDLIEVMSEQNFMNALLRPQAVVRMHLA